MNVLSSNFVASVLVVGGIAAWSVLLLKIGIVIQQRKTRAETYSVLTCLKGTQKPSDIPIGLEGEANDNLLNSTVVANKLMTLRGEHSRLLIFTSGIDTSESTEQTLALFRAASVLNFSIDWVNDSVPYRWREDLIAMLTKYNLRCDNLIESEKLNADKLFSYDIIFHPKTGGMKGAYETLAKFIRMLGDGSAVVSYGNEGDVVSM